MLDQIPYVVQKMDWKGKLLVNPSKHVTIAVELTLEEGPDPDWYCRFCEVIFAVGSPQSIT